MNSEGVWTLSEVARLVGQPQHRLIHLCEKGVVRAEFEEARGRGSSRRFSRRNLLQFAVALKLRELMVPVAPIGAIVHVLDAFEKVLARETPGFRLPDSLAESGAPELRVIITDSRSLFFALHSKKGEAKLFGGIDSPANGASTRRSRRSASSDSFLQPQLRSLLLAKGLCRCRGQHRNRCPSVDGIEDRHRGDDRQRSCPASHCNVQLFLRERGGIEDNGVVEFKTFDQQGCANQLSPSDRAPSITKLSVVLLRCFSKCQFGMQSMLS